MEYSEKITAAFSKWEQTINKESEKYLNVSDIARRKSDIKCDRLYGKFMKACNEDGLSHMKVFGDLLSPNTFKL